jgi:hypothetical protein
VVEVAQRATGQLVLAVLNFRVMQFYSSVYGGLLRQINKVAMISHNDGIWFVALLSALYFSQVQLNVNNSK